MNAGSDHPEPQGAPRLAAGHPGSFADAQPWIEFVAATAWPGCWFLYFLCSRQVRALWKE